MSDSREIIPVVWECVEANTKLRSLVYDGPNGQLDYNELCNYWASRHRAAIERYNALRQATDPNKLVQGLSGYTFVFPLGIGFVAKKKGIYFLFDKDTGELDYIGQSTNIYRRLFGAHHVYNPERHVMGYILCADLNVAENRLIKANCPALNIRLKP